MSKTKEQTKPQLVSAPISQKLSVFPREPKSNLRAVPSSFVGRSKELDILQKQWKHPSLVSVLGPPGVGKTRLAKEYALRFGDEFLKEEAGGVWMCDLTEAKDDLEICACLGQVLHFSFTSRKAGQTEAELLGEALSEKGHLLLILDNFEHLVPYATVTLDVWIKLAPRVRFLVTSRKALGLPGEVLFDLAPLSLLPPQEKDKAPENSEAVQLFLERAQAVWNDFRFTPKELEEVGKLVKRLEGLPLAIELAAARMRILTPSQILAKLKQGDTSLLARQGQQGDSRYQTLREAIELSWSLLSLEEQEVLAQCSIFRGGFDLEAAEKVLKTSQENTQVVDLLQSLCDQSLLYRYLPSEDKAEQPRVPRFGLYLFLREFLEEKLHASEKAQQVKERHRNYFLQVGEKWKEEEERGEQNPKQARMSLSLEKENLLAILERALSGAAPLRISEALQTVIILADFFRVEGHWKWGVFLLDQVLASTEASEKPALVGEALCIRGRLKQCLGQLSEGVQDLENAKKAIEGKQNQVLLAKILEQLARIQYFKGENSQARLYIEQAITLFRVKGNRSQEARGYVFLALIQQHLGEWQECKTSTYQAIHILQEIGNQHSLGNCLANLGNLLLAQGQYQEALTPIRKSLQLQNELKAPQPKVISLLLLGITELELGNLSQAEQYFSRALVLIKEIKAGVLEIELKMLWSSIWQEEGKYDKVEKSLLLVIVLAKDIGATPYINDSFFGLGMLRQEETSFEEALEYYQKTTFSPRSSYEIKRLLCLGSLWATLGQCEKAKESFSQAEPLLKHLQNPWLLKALELHRGHLNLALARKAKEQEDNNQAFSQWQAAYQRLEAIALPKDAPLPSKDLRFSRRVLLQAFSREENLFLSAPSFAPAGTLVYCETERWVLTFGQDRIELKRRPHLFRVCRALLQNRQEAPGKGLSWHTLFEAGWSGTRLRQDSAKNRVRLAIAALRKLGLASLILSGKAEEGYWLDPSVSLYQLDRFAPKG